MRHVCRLAPVLPWLSSYSCSQQGQALAHTRLHYSTISCTTHNTTTYCPTLLLLLLLLLLLVVIIIITIITINRHRACMAAAAVLLYENLTLA